MKMPLRWAQSFADLACTPQEFSDKMTMSGSKVEKFETEGAGIFGVVIGRVEKMEKHPDADTLWICQVNVGNETVQIITSAQNLKEGDSVPAALHGAKLPNGLEIKKGKLRGLPSNGMMCSHDELGLTLHDFPGAAEDGILVLDEDVELGTDAVKALGLDDMTFEFEITPNRPDCLSVRGLAREAAATFGVPFKDHIAQLPVGKGDIKDFLQVELVADDLCSRYTAAIVENVRIATSPRWLRERLRQSGVRPINNIVDITNYVMLEYGHPMHAFDLAYVNGNKITIRRAEKGEQIQTLDGIERALDSEMAVIADGKGTIAVAGVMGGEFSGVYDTTQKIVFESACFDGPSVRRSSKKLGMRTESSSRFEKGLDPNNALPAIKRALELVVQLDAGDVVGGLIDEYPAPVSPLILPLEVEAINTLLGIKIDRKAMLNILAPLDLKENSNGEIVVPTLRGDVKGTCDFAEEIARFVGYNKIGSTVMQGVAMARPTERQTFDNNISDVLTGYGFWECETFSFYSPKCFDMVRLEQNDPLRTVVEISNPLGEETSIMRSTALPSILTVVARNWAVRNEQAALFELATEYIPSKEENTLPQENVKILLAAYGENWDYFKVKGAVEGLLDTAGVKEYTVVRSAENPSYHPGRCADVFVKLANGEEIKLATMGEIHPIVQKNYGVKPRIYVAEISLEALFAQRGKTPQFTPLPKFPATTRDLAFVAEVGLAAAEIEKRIRLASGKMLEKLTLFDVYTGDSLGEDKKSLAYNLVLRSADSTLKDEDADKIVKKILKLMEEINVALRK